MNEVTGAPDPHIAPATKTPEEKRALLSQAIARAVAGGARVESQSDTMAVLVSGRRVNHVLHLILSVCTLGAWLLVWGALVIFGGEKRIVLQVDDYGNVLTQKAT